MQRPGGVTFIAVLDIIGGALCAIVGLLAFAGGSFIASLISAANQGAAGAGSGIAAGIGAIVGVIFLIAAALAIITAIGLMKRKGWGRIIQLVLSALGLLGSVRNFAAGGLHAGGMALGIQLVFLVYYIWTIWYLLTPGVKAAFAGQQPAAVAA
jgi:hypothetical protein